MRRFKFVQSLHDLDRRITPWLLGTPFEFGDEFGSHLGLGKLINPPLSHELGYVDTEYAPVRVAQFGPVCTPVEFRAKTLVNHQPIHRLLLQKGTASNYAALYGGRQSEFVRRECP